ncbi:MAG: pilus assembly protein PilP [Betaproteobacteria bacterium]|nr:pilus assembly protein PilP [Betaproteobacteria bacterium]
MRKALITCCVLLATGCGGEQHNDLRQELNGLTKELRGRVEPLPQVRQYEPVPYKAEGQLDPFQASRIEFGQAASTKGPANSRLQAEQNRPKEPLESYPLEAIRMVGTLTQGPETFGIVRAGPNLFRVKKGNYMGQNFGVINAIDDSQISIKELVQDGGGDWVERAGALQLVQEAQR